MEFFLSGKVKCILFFAAGGGGDVASAAMLALAARRLGLRAYVSTVVWERFVVDPFPGPIPFNCIVGGKPLGNYTMIVNGSCKAFRGGREIVFQAANASRALGEEIIIVDLYGAVHSVYKGLEEAMDYLGCDTVVSVDVGGDILATGYEEDLWSPLADFIALAATAKHRGIVAVHSPGADGELSQSYVLERIALVTRHGGYLGARGVTEEDIKNLEHILQFVESEASRATLLAAKGMYGYEEIRKGSRKTLISPLNLITFFLRAETVASLNPVLKEIENCSSIEEAKRKLNSLGIVTELNLEEEIYKLIEKGVEITGDVLLNIRKMLREKMKTYKSVS